MLSVILSCVYAIQSSLSGSGTSYDFGRIGSLVTTGDASATVEFSLSQADLFALQRNRGLATTESDSYLVWSRNLVSDVDGNQVIEQSATRAYQVGRNASVWLRGGGGGGGEIWERLSSFSTINHKAGLNDV